MLPLFHGLPWLRPGARRGAHTLNQLPKLLRVLNRPVPRSQSGSPTRSYSSGIPIRARIRGPITLIFRSEFKWGCVTLHLFQGKGYKKGQMPQTSGPLYAPTETRYSGFEPHNTATPTNIHLHETGFHVYPSTPLLSASNATS